MACLQYDLKGTHTNFRACLLTATSTLSVEIWTCLCLHCPKQVFSYFLYAFLCTFLLELGFAILKFSLHLWRHRFTAFCSSRISNGGLGSCKTKIKDLSLRLTPEKFTYSDYLANFEGFYLWDVACISISRGKWPLPSFLAPALDLFYEHEFDLLENVPRFDMEIFEKTTRKRPIWF